MSIYDLAHDPHESHPSRIKDGNPKYAAATAGLKAWFERTESSAGVETAGQRDVEVLKSLGYVQ